MSQFSVLMGVYNRDKAEYFAQAMDSILNQTVPSDDIVLSIDGPLTGGLRSTVQDYIDRYSQIHPIWLARNVGQGRSFQQALPQCKHEIVFRMDADDISVPTRFQKQLDFLRSHPRVKLLSSTISEFDGNPDNVVTVKRVPERHADILKMARRWNPINQPSAVFYKSAVFAAGGYRDFYRYEDYYLWVRMLLKGYEAANLPESLLFYRLSSSNLKRRMNWQATRSALRFHRWKYKVGFAGWFDTLYMAVVMLGIFITPDCIFEFIYKRMRR